MRKQIGYRGLFVIFSILMVEFLIPAGRAEAQGLGYNVVLCLRYEVDYQDADGGDWWNTSDDKTARGIRALVQRNSDSADVFYGYTNASTGCTPTLTFNVGQTYLVRLYSEATVANSNLIRVLFSDILPWRYFRTVASSFNPGSPGTYYFTMDDWDTQNIPQTAAAAGYAVHNRYGGMSGETYILYNQACSPGGPSCLNSDTGELYFNDFGKRHKFIIAHEVGHAVGYKRDEGESPDGSGYGATSTQCSEWPPNINHDFASKEWQGAAVSEGFAHFYAATVWNDPSESDCSFYYYKPVDFFPARWVAGYGSKL
ncbi:MAG: DUF3152 domain-containing protein [Deltaproteobacteria bacterium]|nr:DUF3152 domain-containing protein [Deltaproteobacteria bacterium]